MKSYLKGLAVAAALAAGVAQSAGAQTVSFSTVGSFSGTGCTVLSCVFGNFTLSYANQAGASYLSPSQVDFGSFVTSSTGQADPTPIGSGAMFSLMITQTNPSAGNQTISGTLTGTLAYDPSQSSLVFSPSTTFFTIGTAEYTLITDNSGKIAINPPLTNANPNNTSFKANVTVTPEPASLALLATGLVGIFGAVRRKRNA